MEWIRIAAAAGCVTCVAAVLRVAYIVGNGTPTTRTDRGIVLALTVGNIIILPAALSGLMPYVIGIAFEVLSLSSSLCTYWIISKRVGSV